MRSINIIAIALMLLLGACSTTTRQYIETTPDGKYSKKVDTSTFNTTVVEEWDSDMAYQNCLSTVNLRQLGGLTADQYCRQKTSSDRRKRENLRNGEMPGGTSMMGPGLYGPGAMMGPGGFGPGVMMPMYTAPPGQVDWEGTIADPRVASQVTSASQSRSTGNDDDKARDRQVADNASEIREAQERLDRLESQEESGD